MCRYTLAGVKISGIRISGVKMFAVLVSGVNISGVQICGLKEVHFRVLAKPQKVRLCQDVCFCCFCFRTAVCIFLTFSRGSFLAFSHTFGTFPGT